MKTINPKKIFKEIIEKYKKENEQYNHSHDKKIIAFKKGMLKIQNEYFSLFGEEAMEIEKIFKKRIEEINGYWWEDNMPFGDGFYSSNKEFFEQNCLGILDIYEEMRDNEIDFALDHEGNPTYYNFNFHLQNYCFDFITHYFE